MPRGYVGNQAERLLRLRAVRIPTSLVVAVLALTLLGSGCSDEDEPLATGDGTSTTEPARDVDPGPPDIVGTITSVEPFVPVTEDCTPPDDLDPDGAVSSDDPPVCTPEDNDVVGSVLVEEDPTDPSGGRKISFTATSGSVFQGEAPDGTIVVGFDDLAEGQLVRAWVSGDACAESYPEQCGLEAIRVTG